MSDPVRFWVNDVLHVVHDADPRTLLVDYLRSDQVGLTGTKKSCGQGGCGACTVTLTRCNGDNRRAPRRELVPAAAVLDRRDGGHHRRGPRQRRHHA